MDAVISGRAGRALLLDGGLLMSFDVDEPNTIVERREADLHFLFGDAKDLQIIEDAERDQIVIELKQAHNYSTALDLTLISLDGEMSTEVRFEALQELEALLVDYRLREKLENILYARPLPGGGDLNGALALIFSLRFPIGNSFLHEFESRQPLIREVSEAWDSIPIVSFGSYERQAEYQRIGVQLGIFRTLVLSLEDRTLVNSLPLNRLFGTSRGRKVRSTALGTLLLDAIAQFVTIGEGPREISEEPLKARRHVYGSTYSDIHTAFMRQIAGEVSGERHSAYESGSYDARDWLRGFLARNAEEKVNE